MVVTARWQMSHARRPDVFQTGVLPPTQADSFLPRRSSLSGLLTIPQTLGGRDPGKTAKKKFQACAIRVLVGWISIHGFLPIIHRLNICIYIYLTYDYTRSNWNAVLQRNIWCLDNEKEKFIESKICANRKSTQQSMVWPRPDVFIV